MNLLNFKKKIKIITLLFIFATLFTWSQDIALNEIMTSNEVTLADEDGDFNDWIEIYNYGNSTINLDGYGLSDDVDDPFKWTFPAIDIEPNKFVLIWASSKNRIIIDQPLHANFKISSGGEVITLTSKNGVKLSEAPEVSLETDVSYGRQPDGTGQWKFFYTATPNSLNTGTGFSQLLQSPSFSHDSGLYSAAFNLELTTDNPNATIVYTLDGSVPEIDNLGGTTFQYKNVYPYDVGSAVGPLLNETYTSKTYSAPIPIQDRSSEADKLAVKNTKQSELYSPPTPVRKATIIKARIFVNGRGSEIITKTFFVWAGGNPYAIPVISLQIQENYLFDYNDGTYTSGVDFDTWRAENPTNNQPYRPNWNNYWRSGKDWEYPVNIEFFDANSLKSVMNTDGGYRIHGNNSRASGIKNLRLYARSDYDGKGEFKFKLFDEVIPGATFPNNDTFKRIMLRGDGSGGSIAYDVVFNRAMQPMFNGIGRIKPAIHFINGEYWGLTALRDRIDDNHFAFNFGLDKNNVVIVDCKGTNCELDEGEDTDYGSYIDMRDFIIDNDMSIESKYLEAANILDMNSFIDHMVMEIYSANDSYERNFWKARTEEVNPFGDKKWRLTVQDFEASLKSNINWLEKYADTAGAANGAIFGNLLANNNFKNAFINRFADILNSAFTPERFNSIVNTTFNEVAPYLDENTNRYPRDDFYEQSDKDNLIDWGTNRPAIQREQIKQYFALESTINLTANVSNTNAGRIKINTIDIKGATPGISSNPYPWSGIYYKNIPITIEATPLPGYVFSHWSGDASGTEAKTTVTPSGDIQIQANFTSISGFQQLVYFWFMGDAIPNDTPLQNLDATYSRNGLNATINYSSSLDGYPFTDVHANWRKASFERKKDPTIVNYFKSGNNDVEYTEDIMKGMQVRQPFKVGSLENTMEFVIPTTNLEEVKLSLALRTDGAANKLLVDYWNGTEWSVTNLSSSSFDITDEFTKVEVDFSNVEYANNKTEFKIRFRFDGADLTAEDNKEVRFNNIAIEAVETTLSIDDHSQLANLKVYPNPTSNTINIVSKETIEKVELYSIMGQLVYEYSPNLLSYRVNLKEFSNGIYLLKVFSKNAKRTTKIVKK